jgi:hypothetical protein
VDWVFWDLKSGDSNFLLGFIPIYIYIYRGGATLKPGCSVAHPDFLKNQRNFFFFYIDVLNSNKNCEHPQIICEHPYLINPIYHTQK